MFQTHSGRQIKKTISEMGNLRKVGMELASDRGLISRSLSPSSMIKWRAMSRLHKHAAN